ncbi:MAG TPA: hypothetical protein VL588_08835, partial [Bdellovibrionota bacterium]|nr:hypothetical protein [Bdellovibrionota bacterium]
DGFQTDFKNLKGGNPALLKMYSAVSPVDQDGCLGAHAKAGLRYENMANRLGGWSRNLCTQSLSSILSDLSSTLQAQRLDMEVRFLVVSQNPNLSTVHIFRNPGGHTSQRVEIPQDASNGWSFVGYQENQPTVDFPAPLNRRTGYFFRLNGSSALIGADTADVEYLPVGITPQ